MTKATRDYSLSARIPKDTLGLARVSRSSISAAQDFTSLASSRLSGICRRSMSAVEAAREHIETSSALAAGREIERMMYAWRPPEIMQEVQALSKPFEMRADQSVLADIDEETKGLASSIADSAEVLANSIASQSSTADHLEAITNSAAQVSEIAGSDWNERLGEQLSQIQVIPDPSAELKSIMQVHFLGSSSEFWATAQDAFQELQSGPVEALASLAREQVAHWEELLADTEEILRDESARQEFERWIQEGQEEASESQRSGERTKKFRRVAELLLRLFFLFNSAVGMYQNGEFVAEKTRELFRRSAGASQIEKSEQPVSRIVASAQLPVHDSPHRDSKITHTLTADTEVTIADSNAVWVLIEWNEICSTSDKQVTCRGWVLSTYLEVVPSRN